MGVCISNFDSACSRHRLASLVLHMALGEAAGLGSGPFDSCPDAEGAGCAQPGRLGFRSQLSH